MSWPIEERKGKGKGKGRGGGGFAIATTGRRDRFGFGLGCRTGGRFAGAGSAATLGSSVRCVGGGIEIVAVGGGRAAGGSGTITAFL